MMNMIDRFKAWTKTDLAHDLAHIGQSIVLTEGLIQLTGLYPLLCALPAIG